jgi:hypothetical protein
MVTVEVRQNNVYLVLGWRRSKTLRSIYTSRNILKLPHLLEGMKIKEVEEKLD